MTSTRKTIKELSKGKKSNWAEKAAFRQKNKKWLQYSSSIARRVLAAIDSRDDFNQNSLATILNVTPQQVSKIVKGKENLTLETIANLSEALETELITFPTYKYSTQSISTFSTSTKLTLMAVCIISPYKSSYFNEDECKISIDSNDFFPVTESNELKNILSCIRPKLKTQKEITIEATTNKYLLVNYK